MPWPNKFSNNLKTPLIILLFLALSFLSLSLGPTGLSLNNFYIIYKLRLPRLILGFFAGGTLAFCGATLQGLLENPLCDPYILGVASGGALGVSLGLFLGKGGYFLQPFFAFLGSLLAIIFVYNLASFRGKTTKITLLLSGVIISFLFSSLVMLFMIFSKRPLVEIIYLLMGNLSIVFTSLNLTSFLIAILITVGFLIILFGYARDLNTLSQGIEVAYSLGVDIKKMTKIIFFLTSFLTAITVSFAGAISFVGLIVPHLARFLYGPNHQKVLPVSFLLGSILVITADIFARTIAPVELPLSVITAFLGAPFFLYLLKKFS